MHLRLAVAAATVLFASAAHAEIYTLPTDGAWYELQDAVTDRIMCRSRDAWPCDVAPGRYVLLNFGQKTAAGEPVRTPVPVGPSGRPDAAIVHVVERCSGSDCTVSCPADHLPSGVSCAVGDAAGEARATLDLLPRFDATGGYCDLPPGLVVDDLDAEIRLACVRP